MAPDAPVRTAPVLGYATLVAACLLSFRILLVWMTYAHFWLHAWVETVVLAVLVVAHRMTRPQDDPHFDKVATRLVVATMVVMGAFLAFASTIRIS